MKHIYNQDGREAVPDTGEREGGGEVHWEVITGSWCDDSHISPITASYPVVTSLHNDQALRQAVTMNSHQ